MDRRGKRGLPPKEKGGPPMQFMPIPLYALFTQRDPLEFVPKPKKRKCLPYTGIASYVNLFEKTAPPERVDSETIKERKERVKRQKVAEAESTLAEARTTYHPHDHITPAHTTNPLNTIFVGRLSYDITDRKLKREFEAYGPISKVSLVSDKEGNPRGYGFVEFENEKDMKAAYDYADGKKLEGRRIVVDCERGRTVKGWFPRRLGGGKGGRKDKPPMDKYEKQIAKEVARRAERRASLAAAGGGDRDRERDRDRDRGSRGDDRVPPPSHDRGEPERDRSRRDERPSERTSSSYDNRDRSRDDRGGYDRGDRSRDDRGGHSRY